MDIKAVLFDLDGTLLPMDQDKFVYLYFELMARRMTSYGYEPEKLMDSIWQGTLAMIRNDGTCTNEDAFWRVFTGIYGEQALQDKPVIDDFYSNEFNQAQAVCGYAPEVKEIVDDLKAAGKTVILATNPIFPAVATRNRIRWAGLSHDDFLLYTTYENSNYCKPNPDYYKQILEKADLKAEECLMVGNDVDDDMVAETLGMRVFLLTDCLINRKNADISRYPHGSYDALKDYLKTI